MPPEFTTRWAFEYLVGSPTRRPRLYTPVASQRARERDIPRRPRLGIWDASTHFPESLKPVSDNSRRNCQNLRFPDKAGPYNFGYWGVRRLCRPRLRLLGPPIGDHVVGNLISRANGWRRIAFTNYYFWHPHNAGFIWRLLLYF